MSLVTSFEVGRIRCHALEAGIQRLDGGAMFGVVPRPLWQDRIEPDELNRIELAMRCLLIEHEEGLVLIDTGLGNKEEQKFLDIYGIENEGRSGPTQLEDALAEVGVTSDDVQWVINTHLHFDHAGGNTTTTQPPYRDTDQGKEGEKNGPVPSFTNATYIVQRGELEFARTANERTRASYLAANFEPIRKSGQWQPVEGEVEVLPGIRVLPTPGHVPHHQSILVADRGDISCFLGDLIPTSAHVPLPWIMGYDLEPLVTLETKRNLLGRAAAEGWSVVFEHDPKVVRATIAKDPKSFSHKALDTLSDAT